MYMLHYANTQTQLLLQLIQQYILSRIRKRCFHVNQPNPVV
jgi:hypothetical protein